MVFRAEHVTIHVNCNSGQGNMHRMIHYAFRKSLLLQKIHLRGVNFVCFLTLTGQLGFNFTLVNSFHSSD